MYVFVCILKNEMCKILPCNASQCSFSLWLYWWITSMDVEILEPFIIQREVQWQGNNLALANLIYCWNQRLLRILKRTFQVLNTNSASNPCQSTACSVSEYMNFIPMAVVLFFFQFLEDASRWKQISVFSFQCLFAITTIEEYVKSKPRHLHR